MISMEPPHIHVRKEISRWRQARRRKEEHGEREGSLNPAPSKNNFINGGRGGGGGGTRLVERLLFIYLLNQPVGLAVTCMN